jgi:hypothetical protein
LRFAPPQHLSVSPASLRILFPANATETTSLWQGVYTEEQAARGKARYAACTACYAGLLQGESDKSPTRRHRIDEAMAIGPSRLFALAPDSTADRSACLAKFHPARQARRNELRAALELSDGRISGRILAHVSGTRPRFAAQLAGIDFSLQST